MTLHGKFGGQAKAACAGAHKIYVMPPGPTWFVAFPDRDRATAKHISGSECIAYKTQNYFDRPFRSPPGGNRVYWIGPILQYFGPGATPMGIVRVSADQPLLFDLESEASGFVNASPAELTFDHIYNPGVADVYPIDVFPAMYFPDPAGAPGQYLIGSDRFGFTEAPCIELSGAGVNPDPCARPYVFVTDSKNAANLVSIERRLTARASIGQVHEVATCPDGKTHWLPFRVYLIPGSNPHEMLGSRNSVGPDGECQFAIFDGSGNNLTLTKPAGVSSGWVSWSAKTRDVTIPDDWGKYGPHADALGLPTALTGANADADTFDVLMEEHSAIVSGAIAAPITWAAPANLVWRSLADGSEPYQGNRSFGAEMNIYCSPYTGRGAAQALGTTVTFDHFLASRPSLLNDSYYVGIGLKAGVGTVTSGQFSEARGSTQVYVAPRILESTARPRLPGRSEDLVDAIQCNYLDETGPTGWRPDNIDSPCSSANLAWSMPDFDGCVKFTGQHYHSLLPMGDGADMTSVSITIEPGCNADVIDYMSDTAALSTAFDEAVQTPARDSLNYSLGAAGTVGNYVDMMAFSNSVTLNATRADGMQLAADWFQYRDSTTNGPHRIKFNSRGTSPSVRFSDPDDLKGTPTLNGFFGTWWQLTRHRYSLWAKVSGKTLFTGSSGDGFVGRPGDVRRTLLQVDLSIDALMSVQCVKQFEEWWLRWYANEADNGAGRTYVDLTQEKLGSTTHDITAGHQSMMRQGRITLVSTPDEAGAFFSGQPVAFFWRMNVGYIAQSGIQSPFFQQTDAAGAANVASLKIIVQAA